MLMYFGLKVTEDESKRNALYLNENINASHISPYRNSNSSPLRNSLYANTDKAMDELDEFENRNLEKSLANRLIAEELDCSPVRT